MSSLSIHISDVRTFRQCRRRWAWSSPLRQNLEPVVPYVPFFTGRAVHAALEFYYRDGTPFSESLDRYLHSEEVNMMQLGELWPQEALAFEEQVQLIRDILNHYGLWQEQDDKTYCDKNLEFITLETAFDIPMPTMTGRASRALRLGGRFDGVVKHIPTGTYWIWETKTTRSVSELTRSLQNDEQCGTYMYAASKALHVPIVGVLYNIIRKKPPSEPAIISNGGLSKNRNVDTTSFGYIHSIRKLYPDWSDETIMEMYGDVLASLMENEQKFFMRYPVYRSEQEITLLMEGIYQTAREMVSPRTALYPAPSWMNCNFCAFRAPCLTLNAGGDYNVLLNEEYQVRQSALSMRKEVEETHE